MSKKPEKSRNTMWSYDSIHTVQMYLSTANEMWTEQTFCGATDERTNAILAKCRQAAERLDEIIADLEKEAARK